MLARQVVLLTSSESFHPTQLLSRQRSTPVSPLTATLTKNRGRGVLWLTSFLCLPTFRAGRGAVAAKGTCPSALGFLCFLRVSALDSSLYRSPVTSHQSRTA